MTSPRTTETGAQLAAGAKIPSAAFLIPAMIERKKSGHGNARIISRDLFIAIFIPIGECKCHLIT